MKNKKISKFLFFLDTSICLIALSSVLNVNISYLKNMDLFVEKKSIKKMFNGNVVTEQAPASCFIDSPMVSGNIRYTIWPSANELCLFKSSISNEITGYIQILGSLAESPVQAVNPKFKGIVTNLPTHIGNSYAVTSIVGFQNCTGLTGILSFDRNINIQASAFINCSNITDLILTGNTTISFNTFSGDTSLQNIVFPSEFTSVDPTSFQDCNSLKSIHMSWTQDEIPLLSTFESDWLKNSGSTDAFIVVPDELYFVYNEPNNKEKLGISNYIISASTDSQYAIENSIGEIELYLPQLSASALRKAHIKAVNPIINGKGFKYIDSNAFGADNKLSGTLTIDSSISVIQSDAFNLPFNTNPISLVNLNWTSFQIENEILALGPTWLGSLNGNVDVSVPFKYLDSYLDNRERLFLDIAYIQIQEMTTSSLIKNSSGILYYSIYKNENQYDIDLVGPPPYVYSNLIGTNLIINSIVTFNKQIFHIKRFLDRAFQNDINLSGTLTIDPNIVNIGRYVFDGCNNINAFKLNWNPDQIREMIDNNWIHQDWLGNLNNSSTCIIVPAEYLDTYVEQKEDLGISNCYFQFSENITSSCITNASGNLNYSVYYDDEKYENILDIFSADISATNPIINSEVNINGTNYYIHSLNDALFQSNLNLSGIVDINDAIDTIGEDVFDSCNNINSFKLNWNNHEISNMIENKIIHQDWLGSLNSSSTGIIVPIEYLDAYIENKSGLGIDKCRIEIAEITTSSIVTNTTGTINYSIDYDSKEGTSILNIYSTNISGINPIVNSEVTIEDNNYHINKLGDEIFQNNVNLSGTLTIDPNIVNIGSYVFNGCNNINAFKLNWNPDQIREMIDNKWIHQDWLGNLNNSSTSIIAPVQYMNDYITNKDELGISKCKFQTSDNATSIWIDGASGTMDYNIIDDDIVRVISLNNFKVINPVISSKIKINSDSNYEYNIDGLPSGLFQNNKNIIGSVTIDSAITSIGENVFNGCDNIFEIYLNWTKEQILKDSIDINWLGNINKSNLKIIVPQELKEVYRDKTIATWLGIDKCNVLAIGEDKSYTDLPLILGLSLGLGIPTIVGIIASITISIKNHKIKKSS